MQYIQGGIALVVLVAIFLLVSEMDYQDQLAQHEYHCKMIADGLWPPQPHIYCDKP